MGKKVNKHLKVVCFDQEIITKDGADKLLCETKSNHRKEVEKEGISIDKKDVANNVSNSNTDLIRKNEWNETDVSKNKKRKKKKLCYSNDQLAKENESQEVNEINVKIKKKKIDATKNQQIPNEAESEKMIEESAECKTKEIKRKKKKKLNVAEMAEQQETETPDEPEGTDEISIENPKVKTGESIRAQKRKKHMKLIEEKRLKTELTSQQNVLNYLSKWKHCRNEWKFEKLKQIWLQQNLFDTSKIPNEFWETAVEYFSNSKGFIRKVVLRDALKIIEKEESIEEENTDDSYLLKLERARSIVQNLQE